MKNIFLPCRIWNSLVCIIVVIAFCHQQALPNDVVATSITPGIHFSQAAAYRLSAEQKKSLLASLQRITGWSQPRVDESDRLLLDGAQRFVGGSVWARRVISEVFRAMNMAITNISTHLSSVHQSNILSPICAPSHGFVRVSIRESLACLARGLILV